MKLDESGRILTSDRNVRELKALCESPIEYDLGVALIEITGKVAVWSNDPEMDRVAILHDPSREWTLCVAPQVNVWARGKRYRADFLVMAQRQGSEPVSVVVECDGHEFHDRTKEQASSDRARDRAVQCEGMLVARFTGADIHADPGLCAIEVWQMAGLIPKPPAKHWTAEKDEEGESNGES